MTKPYLDIPYVDWMLGRHSLGCGDCLDLMPHIPECSVDAVVSDPPYGIGFHGASWDEAPPGDQWAAECHRILKPGGYVIAFGATRTLHRLTAALEDAGFEIRDVFHWCYFNGYPKNYDISAGIDKALGREREVVGTKLSGIAVPGERRHTIGGSHSVEVPLTAPASLEAQEWSGWGTALKPAIEPAVIARKTPQGSVVENVLKWRAGGINIDDCRLPLGDPMRVGPARPHPWEKQDCDPRWPSNLLYVPKPSTAEKEAGLKLRRDQSTVVNPAGPAGWEGKGRRNNHPTVKPIKLMRYLIRLVCAKDAVVCDPFLGSGTTLLAAELSGVEGIRCLGIERDPDFCELIRARYDGIDVIRRVVAGEAPSVAMREAHEHQISLFSDPVPGVVDDGGDP